MGQSSLAIIHLLCFLQVILLVALTLLKHIITMPQKGAFFKITVLALPLLSSPGLQGAAALCLSAIKHLEISGTMQQHIIG